MEPKTLTVLSGEHEILLTLFETENIELFRENEDLKREGIYLLMLSRLGEPLLGYVGQAKIRKSREAILQRIREHLRDPFKPDWSHALTISIRNKFLNEEELDYLENRLWQILSSSQNIEISNEREPSALAEPDNWMELEKILKELVDKLNEIGIQVFGQISMFHL